MAVHATFPAPAPAGSLLRTHCFGGKENMPLQRSPGEEAIQRLREEKHFLDMPRRGKKAEASVCPPGLQIPESRQRSPADALQRIASGRRSSPALGAREAPQPTLGPLRSLVQLPQSTAGPQIQQRVRGLRRSMNLLCQSSGRREAEGEDNVEEPRLTLTPKAPRVDRPLSSPSTLKRRSVPGLEMRCASAPLARAPAHTSPLAGGAGAALSRHRKELDRASSLPTTPEEGSRPARRHALALDPLDPWDPCRQGRGSQSQASSKVLELLAVQRRAEASPPSSPGLPTSARFGEPEAEDQEEAQRGSKNPAAPAGLAPSLAQALARYDEDGCAEEGEVQRMRVAYRRFVPDATSELARDSLHDALVHLGYLNTTAAKAEEIGRTVSEFSTLDFTEFCQFAEKFARHERTATLEKLATWPKDCSRVEGLQRLLVSMGVVATRKPVLEALEAAGLGPGAGSLSPEELLRFLAARRMQEGFTAEEVAAARAAYEGLQEDAKPGRGGLPKVSELLTGLLRFLGLYCGAKHRRILMQKMPQDTGGLPTLSFYEFLIWARRLREMELEELWELFQEADGDGDGWIRVADLRRLLARLGFTLLDEAISELLAAAGLQREQAMDFSDTVHVVKCCHQCDGFTPSEAQEFSVVFDRFDISKTGELPHLQVLDMLRYLGHSARLDEVPKFMSRVDMDSNGTMDRKEFLMLMRFLREQDMQRARAAFDRLRAGASSLPAGDLERALEAMGHRPPPEVLESLREAEGYCRQLSFEAFVRSAERCRAAVAVEGRRRAGLSNETFDTLRSIFGASDAAHRGFIGLGELVWMLSDSAVPVNTAEGRRTLLGSLEAARRAAREAGVQEDEVGEAGSTCVRFWDLVHLVQGLIRKHEQAVVAREQEALEQTRFSAAEAANFREIFIGMIAESNGVPDEGSPPTSPAKAGPRPTLSGLLRQFTSVSVLPRRSLVRAMCSIGLRLSSRQREELDGQLRAIAPTGEGLDFASFLQVIRWMLDTNFADINKAAEKEVERLKKQGHDVRSISLGEPAAPCPFRHLDTPTIRSRRSSC